MALTGFGTFYSLFQIAGVTCAVIWAFSFEPVLHYYSPTLHDRDINEGIMPPDEEDGDYEDEE